MATTAPLGPHPASHTEAEIRQISRWSFGIASIWFAVVVISYLSPDLVGPDQHHVPIAATLTWVWGLVATRSFITASAEMRDREDEDASPRRLVTEISAFWFIAAFISVFVRESVTIAGQAHLPVGALAPIAATVLTVIASGTSKAAR